MSAEWEMSRIALIRARSRATWQRIKRLLLSKAAAAAAITPRRRQAGRQGTKTGLEQVGGRKKKKEKKEGRIEEPRKSSGLIRLVLLTGVLYAVTLV